MNSLKHFGFIVYLQLCFFCSLAQNKYYITNYTTKNGLPENNLQSLQFDSAGFLWISYSNGLLRFDGFNFRNYTTSSVPYSSFSINKTTQQELLAWDVSGTVFEIKNQKIISLRKGPVNSINYFTLKGTLPSKSYYLNATTPHFNTKRDRNWHYPPLTVFPITGEDAVIRTKTGVGYYHFTQLKRSLDLQSYSPTHFIGINNQIYFFTANNQIYRIDVNLWKVIPCNLIGDLATSFLFKNHPELLSNTFWDYSTSSSCLLFENSLFELKTDASAPNLVKTKLLTSEIPQNCLVTSLIYHPKDELLLVSTDSRGLFVFREQKFKFLTYPNPERGTNNSYYFQLDIDSNTVYTDWGREFTKEGGRKSSLNLDRNYSENVFRDKSGWLWYMKNERILKRYNPRSKEVKTIFNPKNELVLCFYEEGDSIWVGCTQSIGYVKNDTLRIVKELENNNSNSNIFQLMRWKNNKLLVCNYTGLFEYDPITQDLDTIKELYQKYPYSFIVYNDFLMISTFGRGYYFYKDGITRKMPQDANHYLQQAYLFVNDSAGYTWIATSNGIYKTRFADLEKYFYDTTYAVSYLHYGEEEGIASPEFNGGCVPSYITLKNGYTSLPNGEGLVWFKPSEINNPDFSSAVYIDGIYADDSLQIQSKLNVIPSNCRLVRIDFSTPFWGTSDNLMLEYKLEGYSKQWLRLTSNQNSVSFSNLSSGNYVFKLRKRSGLNPNDFIVTSIPFVVEKKYYETIWFLLGCILLAALFTFIVARIYAYNINKRNKALELSVQQRTAELIKANDELKQSVSVKDKLISIIAHDIITPLNFITVVAQKSARKNTQLDYENMQSVLADIKNTTQKLRDNAQNILSWIKHQNKRITINKGNIAVAAFVEDISDQFIEIAASKNSQITVSISEEDIIKSDATILSIVLHNLISNACKFTENGSIEIIGGFTLTGYSFTVKDNGSGMKKEQKARILSIVSKVSGHSIMPVTGDHGNGLGYIIIGELLEFIKGTLSLESEVGVGTSVTIQLLILD